MLSEMAWKILHGDCEFHKFTHARMAQVEAGIAELTLQRVLRTFVFPRTDHRCQACERVIIEAEGFTDLESGKASAIGDEVSGHRSAESSVELVDILDDELTLIHTRKVEIAVAPL